MTNFYLQNKDNILAEISVDKNKFTIHNYNKELDKLFYNFEKWLYNRIDITDRLNIHDMCKISGMRNLEEYVKYTKSISVVDTFWLNDLSCLSKWKDVNVFSNEISKIIADGAIDGVHLLKGQNIKSPSPQFSLKGSADKCVKRHRNKDDDSIYLYKSCGELWREPMNVRPYSEHLVSQLENKLNFTSYVDYRVIEKLTENNKIKPYSICKIFTNENEGLLDYGHSIHKNTDLISLRKQFKQRNLVRDYKIITEMLILDSITLNIDRHDSNYAFIFNTNNLSIKGLSPIFDNDCALGSTISLEEKTFDDAYNELMIRHTRTKLGTFDDQALAVIDREMYNKLKSIGHITFNFDNLNLNGLSDTRKEFIEYLVNRRIREIIDITEKTYKI